MATAITTWHSDIAPLVHGSSTGMKTRALRQACIEFCRETLLWTDDLKVNPGATADFSVVADANEFDLADLTDTSGAGTWLANEVAQIVSIQSVKYKGEDSDGTALDVDQFKTLNPITKDSWDRRDTGNWPYRESTSPSGFYLDRDRKLYLYPIPTEDSDTGIRISANLEPTRTATTVPDFLYENYYNCILDGALSYLFRMSGQTWEDVPLAQLHRDKYLKQLADAKHTKWKGRTTRSLGVYQRRFV